MFDILARPGCGTIAYRRTEGRGPTVLFLTGFRSDMTGSKAVALERWAQAAGRAFIRFDYTGHGQSSGAFADGTVGQWKNDTLTVIDGLTAGPLVLVGSSMGGWIMLLAALARPGRVAGLVGIAPAADFVDRLIWQRFDPALRATLAREGRVALPSAYSPEPTIVTAALIEEGRRHLVLGAPIPFAGPVRLIHGTADPDVPVALSRELAARLTSPDIETILVEGGDHRLSTPRDLDRLCRVTGEVCALAERAA